MICFPLDNTEYGAEALGAYLCTRTRGVFSAETNLAVAAAGGMSVTVSPGMAWLKWSEYWGTCALQPQALTLTVEPADGALSRIDAVVCRLDKIKNCAEITVKKGAYASAPTVVAPVRNDNYDEIYIATISVNAGTIALSVALITDQRLNETYCGLMRDGVTGIPTAMLQAQAQDLIDQLRTVIAGIEQGSEVMLRTIYDPQGKATDIFSAIPGRNLGDNTDFINPVNQRALTAYPQHTYLDKYTIDRWKSTVSNIQITENGILVSRSSATADDTNLFYQLIHGLTENEIYTFSVTTTVGTYFVTGPLTSTEVVKNTPFGKIGFGLKSDGMSRFKMQFSMGDATLVSAKIEKGVNPTPFVPKGYGVELEECMRYYQKVSSRLVLYGTATVGKSYSFSTPYSPMRIVPTVTTEVSYVSGVATYNALVSVVGSVFAAIDANATTVDFIATFVLNADL